MAKPGSDAYTRSVSAQPAGRVIPKVAKQPPKRSYRSYATTSSISNNQLLPEISNEDNEICSCAGVGQARHDPNAVYDEHNLASLEEGLGSLARSRATRRSVKYERWLFGKVLDPRSKNVHRWNHWFLLSCAVGIALDPLFLSILSISKRLTCLYVQKGFLIAVTVLRSVIDAMYLVHIWMQLKLAYVSKQSLVLGQGELVWDAREIALRHYLQPLSGFAFDIYIIVPLPQIMMWVITPHLIKEGKDAPLIMTYIFVTFLLQYIPKIFHLIQVIRHLRRFTGYIVGTASAGFFMNLFTYFIAAHVAGCCWYLLTVQRVVTCLHQHCQTFPNCGPSVLGCPNPIAYRHQWTHDATRVAWGQDENTKLDCLSRQELNFTYGIYGWGVPLVTDGRPLEKFLYPLFWGVMTFSSFGNALVPSNHMFEVTFAIFVITCGLLLFAMLIGNIQVFLHSITSKEEVMQLRVRDLEWWMRRRQLPAQLRHRVRQHERQRWAATLGIDEEILVGDLPEGLRRDIKRHLCLDLVRQVPLFEQMDDLVLNNICERLKPLLFIKGEQVIYEGNPVRQMLFIVRGHMQSMYRLYNNKTSFCVIGPGTFCGDELISWCLNKPKPERLPLSVATLTTMDMTEVFALDAQDLRYITDQFRSRFANAKLKHTARYYSFSWRMWAAVTVQLAWRRYKARRSHIRQGSLNLAEVAAPDDALSRDPHLEASQKDRLRMYTAMFISPKPQE